MQSCAVCFDISSGDGFSKFVSSKKYKNKYNENLISFYWNRVFQTTVIVGEVINYRFTKAP